MSSSSAPYFSRLAPELLAAIAGYIEERFLGEAALAIRNLTPFCEERLFTAIRLTFHDSERNAEFMTLAKEKPVILTYVNELRIRDEVDVDRNTTISDLLWILDKVKLRALDVFADEETSFQVEVLHNTSGSLHTLALRSMIDFHPFTLMQFPNVKHLTISHVETVEDHMHDIVLTQDEKIKLLSLKLEQPAEEWTIPFFYLPASPFDLSELLHLTVMSESVLDFERISSMCERSLRSLTIGYGHNLAGNLEDISLNGLKSLTVFGFPFAAYLGDPIADLLQSIDISSHNRSMDFTIFIEGDPDVEQNISNLVMIDDVLSRFAGNVHVQFFNVPPEEEEFIRDEAQEMFLAYLPQTSRRNTTSFGLSYKELWELV